MLGPDELRAPVTDALTSAALYPSPLVGRLFSARSANVVKDVSQLPEAQRETERLFAEEAADEPPPVTGWSPALLMFHVSRWRERLRDALTPASQGLPVPVPPADGDVVNNTELPLGAGIPLSEAAVRSDETVRRLRDLWEEASRSGGIAQIPPERH